MSACLDHARHDVWLRDGLALVDRQRRIVIGELLHGLRQESLARHLLHIAASTRRSADAAAGDLAADHASARVDDGCHDGETTRAGTGC